MICRFRLQDTDQVMCVLFTCVVIKCNYPLIYIYDTHELYIIIMVIVQGVTRAGRYHGGRGQGAA